MDIAQAVIDAFSHGVDYGLLLAEQERAGESMGDAVLCAASGYKYGVPSPPMRTRRLHSQAWFDAKNESLKAFITLFCEIGGSCDD
jgi:hypothetical protein